MCIYVYMYICIYVYMYICIYVYMYICIYVCLYICVCIYLYTYIYIYMYLCMCVCVCMHACMRACLYVHMYVCLYVCMHVYLFVCLYMMYSHSGKYGHQEAGIDNLLGAQVARKVGVCVYVYVHVFFRSQATIPPPPPNVYGGGIVAAIIFGKCNILSNRQTCVFQHGSRTGVAISGTYSAATCQQYRPYLGGTINLGIVFAKGIRIWQRDLA